MGGRGGCDLRIKDFFGKLSQKKFGGGSGGGGGVGLVGWVQGGCERRIEVFVKFQKKWGGGVRVRGGGGVRVDVNEELKFL